MLNMFFGENYCETMRKMLTADETLLPDRIIEAELNIGATKKLMDGTFEACGINPDDTDGLDKVIDTQEKLIKMQEIARNYHCAVLSVMLRSRTKKAPFNLPRYKKNWNIKRRKFIELANNEMMDLLGFDTEKLKKQANEFLNGKASDQFNKMFRGGANV